MSPAGCWIVGADVGRDANIRAAWTTWCTRGAGNDPSDRHCPAKPGDCSRPQEGRELIAAAGRLTLPQSTVTECRRSCPHVRCKLVARSAANVTGSDRLRTSIVSRIALRMRLVAKRRVSSADPNRLPGCDFGVKRTTRDAAFGKSPGHHVSACDRQCAQPRSMPDVNFQRSGVDGGEHSATLHRVMAVQEASSDRRTSPVAIADRQTMA